MIEALTGLIPSQALRRLLHFRGMEIPPEDLSDLPKSAPEMGSMAFELRRHGLWARDALGHGRELEALDLPTLLRLQDGGWIVLLKFHNGWWRVEDASGEKSLPAEALEAASDGRVFDLAPMLPRVQSFWRIVPNLLLPQRRTLWLILIMSFGLQLLTLLSPQFTRLAMDRVLPEGASSLLMLVTLGMAVTALFQAWVGWLRQRTILYLESRLGFILSQGFLAHLLSLPFEFLNGKTLGELLQANAGLDAARNLFTERLLGIVLDGIMASLYLVVMVSTMPGPTGLVVLTSVLMAVVTIVVGRKQSELQRKEIDAQAKERGFLVEVIRGIATVKAAGAEAPCIRRWFGFLGKVLRIGLMRQRYGLWTEVGLDGVRYGLTVATLVWGGLLVLDGQVKVGSLMAFVQMSTLFLSAILGVAQAYLGFVVLRPQIGRVNEILNVEPEHAFPSPKSKGVGGPVVIQDIWFRYAPELPWVFKGYNLRVEAGDKLWLRAPSGFGKSTLLRLISGLYTPQKGDISVDGLNPEEARGQLIYLPQFVQLYGGSILENLRLLSGGATHDKLMEASEISGLHRIISQLPMGYNTILPPGGGSLSGGQRQLVAITAVMASDRRLLLLDEAMANLDWLNRSWLQRSPWFENRTIIYASHDAGIGN